MLTSVAAQKKGNPALAEGVELRLQYDTMMDVSNSYREGRTDFKVVRHNYLDAFVANVSDSIVTYTERIENLEEEQRALQADIDENASQVAERDETIEQLTQENDNVSLLGVQMSRSTYGLIMWALVVGLLVALLVAIGSTRVAAANSAELERERDKLTKELEQSRKRRLSVEQDLRRQLQDVRNRSGQ